MRLVLDSNLFISSLITVDTPPDLLCRQWRDRNFDLITSREQIAEVLRVTGYVKLQKYFTPEQAADLKLDVMGDRDRNIIKETHFSPTPLHPCVP